MFLYEYMREFSIFLHFIRTSVLLDFFINQMLKNNNITRQPVIFYYLIIIPSLLHLISVRYVHLYSCLIQQHGNKFQTFSVFFQSSQNRSRHPCFSNDAQLSFEFVREQEVFLRVGKQVVSPILYLLSVSKKLAVRKLCHSQMDVNISIQTTM